MSLDSTAHLRLTEAFINERPVDISIIRRKKIKTENGGSKFSSPSTLPSQTVRKVGVENQDPVLTSDGNSIIPTSNLIGMPDMDIQSGDKFTLNGVVHEVVTVNKLPEWRVRAALVEYGG